MWYPVFQKTTGKFGGNKVTLRSCGTTSTCDAANLVSGSLGGIFAGGVDLEANCCNDKDDCNSSVVVGVSLATMLIGVICTMMFRI